MTTIIELRPAPLEPETVPFSQLTQGDYFKQGERLLQRFKEIEHYKVPVGLDCQTGQLVALDRDTRVTPIKRLVITYST